MKKYILIAVLAVFTLSLASCGKTGDPGETKTGGNGKFMAGYGEADITPSMSLPLAGYGNTEKRLSTGLYSFLKTTCVAVTDEDGSTVLIIANDLVRSHDSGKVDWYTKVSEATGVPISNIIFNGSHTHSGPDLSQTKVAAVEEYKPIVTERIVEAAQAAMNDRSEAKMYMTRTTVENMNFQRHFLLADGTKTGYSPESGNPAVDYAGYVDHTMQLLKFGRKEQNPDKKDIILTNWQGHNHRAGSQSDTNITADVAGIYRDTVNKALDCHTLYINGASGNANFSSPIKEDNITKDFKDQGKALAQFAIDAAEKFEEIATGKIRVETYSFDLKYDHSMDNMIESAKIVRAYWQQTNDISATKAYGKPYNINSPYHANKIVNMVNMPGANTVSMSVGCIGDFAFACFPGEMFAKGGMNVKENSPFPMTFFVGYSNGHNGYFPTEDAYEYVGYETDVTQYVRGCAETVTNDMVQRLTELYNTK